MTDIETDSPALQQAALEGARPRAGAAVVDLHAPARLVIDLLPVEVLVLEAGALFSEESEEDDGLFEPGTEPDAA